MPRTKEAFQQIRDESRQHILDIAAHVFVKKGLANTKVSDLAETAGISQGLLYRYFADKDAVFITLLERAINGVTGYTQTAMRKTGSSLEKFRWLTEKILEGMAEEPVYFQLFAQAIALPGRVKKTLRKLEKAMEMLRDLIIEGQKIGEIARRDPDQMLLLYLSCLYGLAAGKSTDISWIDEHFPTSEAVLQVLKP
jgi:AcrR family transcriptional regulator